MEGQQSTLTCLGYPIASGRIWTVCQVLSTLFDALFNALFNARAQCCFAVSSEFVATLELLRAV